MKDVFINNFVNNNMETTNPKVSLLVSTYNWKEALNLCVRSIFAQTVLPDEIIIADDGSREDTRAVIEQLQKESSVPVIHVWHEDKGFRRTEIMNKAIVAASGDYLLQVDGDVILSPYFVSDHLEVCQPNCFVCGSRVKLDKEISEQILSHQKFELSPWKLPLSFVLNSFRSRCLRAFLADRYARKIDHLRGCNMAFWRSDLFKVNGYNEDLLQWGYEDGELAFRLHYAGVHKRCLLYTSPSPRD